MDNIILFNTFHYKGTQDNSILLCSYMRKYKIVFIAWSIRPRVVT